MEDGVLRAEQYDRSDTDSDEEGGDDMYDDTQTDTLNFWFWINITDFSASYTRVQLLGGLLVLKPGASYMWVQLIHEYI